jgi:hypothetical protein
MKMLRGSIGAVLVLATGAVLGATPATKEAPPRQLHWKSEMTGKNVPPGLTSETWLKGERVRTVMQTPMGESVVVVKDKVVYMKTGSMAMKVPVDAQQQKGPMPRPTDYATKLEELLKGGKKVGTEEIDGEACDKWVIHPEGAAGEETLWISPSLHFPRQIAVRTDAGEIVVKNKDIQTKVTLDEKLFDPDPTVTYQDMGAMRRGGAAPAPPPPAEKDKK